MIARRLPFRATLAAVGQRARQLRIIRQLPQTELAQRAGIGVATVIRFEASGTASLANVLRMATALNADAAFEKLFEAPPYASLDEALERPAPGVPKRVRRPRS